MYYIVSIGADDQRVFWTVVKKIQNTTQSAFIEFTSCNTTQADKMRQDLPPRPITVHDHENDHLHKNGNLFACPLDECLYSAGMLRNDLGVTSLRKELTRRHEKPILLHANWIKGHDEKRETLQNHSLWMTKGDWSCSDFHPWFSL